MGEGGKIILNLGLKKKVLRKLNFLHPLVLIPETTISSIEFIEMYKFSNQTAGES